MSSRGKQDGYVGVENKCISLPNVKMPGNEKRTTNHRVYFEQGNKGG